MGDKGKFTINNNGIIEINNPERGINLSGDNKSRFIIEGNYKKDEDKDYTPSKDECDINIEKDAKPYGTLFINNNSGYAIASDSGFVGNVDIKSSKIITNSTDTNGESAIFLGNTASQDAIVNITNSRLDLKNNSTITTSSAFESYAGTLNFTDTDIYSLSKAHYNFDLHNNPASKKFQQATFDNSNLHLITPEGTDPKDTVGPINKSFNFNSFIGTHYVEITAVANGDRNVVGINTQSTQINVNNGSTIDHISKYEPKNTRAVAEIKVEAGGGITERVLVNTFINMGGKLKKGTKNVIVFESPEYNRSLSSLELDSGHLVVNDSTVNLPYVGFDDNSLNSNATDKKIDNKLEFDKSSKVTIGKINDPLAVDPDMDDAHKDIYTLIEMVSGKDVSINKVLNTAKGFADKFTGKDKENSYFNKSITNALPKIVIDGGSVKLPMKEGINTPSLVTQYVKDGKYYDKIPEGAKEEDYKKIETKVVNSDDVELTHFVINKDILSNKDYFKQEEKNPNVTLLNKKDNTPTYYVVDKDKIHEDGANIWYPKATVKYYNNKDDANNDNKPIKSIDVPDNTTIGILKKENPTLPEGKKIWINVKTGMKFDPEKDAITGEVRVYPGTEIPWTNINPINPGTTENNNKVDKDNKPTPGGSGTDDKGKKDEPTSEDKTSEDNGQNPSPEQKPEDKGSDNEVKNPDSKPEVKNESDKKINREKDIPKTGVDLNSALAAGIGSIGVLLSSIFVRKNKKED